MNNKNKKNDTKAQKKAESVTDAFVAESSYKNDPFGCYTGKPKDPKDTPEQDADDL